MFGYRLQKIWKQPSVAQIERTLSELATDGYGKGHFNTEADWMAAVGDVDRLERMCTDALEAIGSRA